jgi:hypothetical protein
VSLGTCAVDRDAFEGDRSASAGPVVCWLLKGVQSVRFDAGVTKTISASADLAMSNVRARLIP